MPYGFPTSDRPCITGRKTVDDQKNPIAISEARLAILIYALAAGILFAGFFVGRYTALAYYKKQIKSITSAYTLGHQLKNKKNGDEQIAEVLPAYYPESRDAEAINSYSWSPPNMPTPFVGSAPVPGEQDNAAINKLQFRSKKEVVTPKPSGVYRIFLTGGSTAYSSGAPSEDRTIGAYLERKLNEKLGQNGKTVEVFTVANPACLRPMNAPPSRICCRTSNPT
ncbi:hypothetical protein [Methylogaea oryzae]|uniref:hypothetical protein n=1 Tax=Methylogaea oryzae TaxID=1295382 RepID=UPI0006D183DE|nr:hypothetical protein [Methylogaea oryzae]